ncbi:uncharacterized protein [Aegilops tauschii subsp. strangulata]|uniref:uncharacterized protein n=1 Tax=Aegilops tauschii subsp. strangulata TaxID=200361 RepID=UPI001E1CA145|nr:uncharacterized protein LOC123496881 [Aegilops tauschii subsp. strangulata]
MVAVFGPEYPREPTAADTERLLAINADRGFPGMLGSIDCMHWKWKNYPFAWEGQYKGHVKVFVRLAEGHSPEVNYEINGHHYNKGYYLADDIYPQWSTLVKTIPNPQGEKRPKFVQMQESARKDVEHAFGVLHSRLGIVRNPALTWSTQKLWEVMTACVIMHNMIVEDERDDSIYDQGYDFQGENVGPEQPPPATFEKFVHFNDEMRDWQYSCPAWE